MENCKSSYFLTLFIIFSLIPYVFTIKCWTCRSAFDPNCADPFDSTWLPITDCRQELDFSNSMGSTLNICQKIRQKVNGEWSYIRGCGYLNEVSSHGNDKLCTVRTDTDGILTEYCTCNGRDGCNASSLINPFPILLLVLIGLGKILC